MFAAIAAGSGLLVAVIVGCVFEQITGYTRTGAEPSQAQLEQKIEEIQDSELVYELKLLLAERRMGRWWKFLVWLIVSSVIYAIMFLRLCS